MKSSWVKVRTEKVYGCKNHKASALFSANYEGDAGLTADGAVTWRVVR